MERKLKLAWLRDFCLELWARAELRSFLSTFNKRKPVAAHTLFPSVYAVMAYRLNKRQVISAVRFYYMSTGNAAQASCRLLSEEYQIHEVKGRSIKFVDSRSAKFGGRPDSYGCSAD